ncbi:MAG: hypothetical protein GC162_06280 [Planctomycetes bacterium]|nr:hypothetical protein [Planctomycetota bacterium]
MMLTLAEIADKTPTAVDLWRLCVAVSLPLLMVFTCVRRDGAMVLIAGALSAIMLYVMSDAIWFDGDCSEAIRRELGARWVAHAMAASLFPLMMIAIAAAVRRRTR